MSSVLTRALRELLQHGVRRLRIIERAVVEDETAETRGTATDILGTGDELDVHPEVLGMEGRERHHRGIGKQRHAMPVGDVGEALDISHIELGVRDDLKEQSARMVIDGSLHLLEVTRVNETRLHPERAEGVAQERDGVAEEMLGSHNVDLLSRQGGQRIADGSHTRVEGSDAQRPRPPLHPALEILRRRVGDATVGMFHGTAGKSIARGLGGVETVGRTVINREVERSVSVGLDEGCLQDGGLIMFAH